MKTICQKLNTVLILKWKKCVKVVHIFLKSIVTLKIIRY